MITKCGFVLCNMLRTKDELLRCSIWTATCASWPSSCRRPASIWSGTEPRSCGSVWCRGLMSASWTVRYEKQDDSHNKQPSSLDVFTCDHQQLSEGGWSHDQSEHKAQQRWEDDALSVYSEICFESFQFNLPKYCAFSQVKTKVRLLVSDGYVLLTVEPEIKEEL